MASRRLAKPVYKRQQFLLSFLKELNESLTAIEFQKLLFLYITENNLTYYEFVPYLYGGYSIQAGEDINTLQAMGWLTDINGKIQYTGGDDLSGLSLPFEGIGKSISDQLPKVRGNRLVKFVYEQYPYYAINSRTAASIMDTAGIAKIRAVKEQFKQAKRILFTIGYEGITIEHYLNTLIKNDIQVLCDVRNNPLSRKFGFSKSNLQKYLGNIGIEYIHFPELGIKSEKRNNLNSDEDYQNLFKEYKSSLSNCRVFLEKLYLLLENKNRIALTCFEHEALHCHRHVIRDYLKNTYNVQIMGL
jgi:Ca2+-binding EF-hand superfamily protein